MATGEFHKMHGLGNDFVIIDARAHPMDMPPARARQIADRKQGIGCDQLILLLSSDIADVAMRIFNPDGNEVEACGNASRCVIALLKQDLEIETKGGIISGQLSGADVTVVMGDPKFDWQDIPLAFAMDTRSIPVGWLELENPMAVNMGNPHVVFFVENVNNVDLAQIGPNIEHDAIFPKRVNVNVASVEGNEIHLSVWERGAGLTGACGTGACATAVAGIRQGKVNSPVTVHQSGGSLSISWAPGEPVIMTGSATYVFTGQADWDDFG
ncbi:diaminopimelate epimerase [Sphingorhabdus sp.]|uniref:diaminopimelate epimerase n=1 Tax=Sphingorhabdus sp. TaxID=1902408 RepID=UPI00391BA67C